MAILSQDISELCPGWQDAEQGKKKSPNPHCFRKGAEERSGMAARDEGAKSPLLTVLSDHP